MKKFTKLGLVAAALLMGVNAWADEIAATLVHTASTSCGTSTSTVTGTVDAELEHVNNEGSGTWQGYAFAEFSFSIPEDQVVTKAVLTWSVDANAKARNHTWYYLTPGTVLDYETIASETPSLLRYNNAKTFISTDNFSGGATKNTDVTDAINASLEQGNVIFQLTNNAGGTNLYGKGSAEKHPTLVITTTSKASSCDYVVKAVDGNNNVLKVFEEGTCAVSDNKVVYYPYALLSDGVWYTTSASSYGVTIVESGEINIAYTPNTSIVLFSEGEGGYANVWAPDNASNYSSGNICNNNDGRVSGSALNTQDRGLTVGTLPMGKYKLYVMVVGKNRRGINLRSGSSIIATVDNSTATSGIKSVEFTLYSETSNLLLNGNNNGSKSTQLEDIDYFYIEKISDDVTYNVAVPEEVGYATYRTPYAMDFTNVDGLTAYVATAVGDNVVTITPVEDAVPAGTGLLLKGNTASVPVVASATAPATNYFVGVATETVIESGYVLAYDPAKIEETLGFYEVKDTPATVGAGKAYLSVPSNGARLRMIVAGETSSIQGVETVTNDNAVIYNLAGQRVNANAKGIVIINGKKVVK